MLRLVGYFFSAVCCLGVLSACSVFPPYLPKQDKPVITMKEPNSQSIQIKPIDHAQIMSNENVIVYPLEGKINPARQSFPEYRGVLDNTTSGGYTAFDPSVTIFAIEGQGMRPDYMPQYAAPSYVQPKRQAAITQAPLLPLNVVESSGLSPQMNIPRAPSKTPVGERSGPVLTSYD